MDIKTLAEHAKEFQPNEQYLHDLVEMIKVMDVELHERLKAQNPTQEFLNRTYSI